MSGIKVVLEQFVVGDLDFASLERELAGGAAVGETRETALEALEQLTRRENLSSAVTGLLRRAIDRHFAMDDTDPFPRIRPCVENPPPPTVLLGRLVDFQTLKMELSHLSYISASGRAANPVKGGLNKNLST